jgi:Flp pilus assembly protein TadG
VEFVLVLGILTAVLFLAVEVGMALNVRLIVAGAAREGARRAAIEGGDTPAVRAAIERQLALAPCLDQDKTIVTIVPATASYGTQVTVMVRVVYGWRTPVGRTLLGASLEMHSEAVSRSEKVRTGT